MALPRFVSAAQTAALFGVPDAIDRAYTPYKRAFGDAATPYDLNAPGAVAEIKVALRALGQAGSNPDGNSAPIIETAWKAIGDGDVWDVATALEFVLFVSRSKGKHYTETPYTQQPTYPSLPQPAVMGLELLAAEVNDRLKGATPLKLYEAWRGGPTKPPSMINRPTPNTPVTSTYAIDPNTMPPLDAPPQSASLIKAADSELTSALAAAYAATNEIDRDAAAHNAMAAAKSRSFAIRLASLDSPSQQQLAKQCEADGGQYEFGKQRCLMRRPSQSNAQVEPPPQSGSAVPLVVGGIVLLGIGFAAYKYHQR